MKKRSFLFVAPFIISSLLVACATEKSATDAGRTYKVKEYPATVEGAKAFVEQTNIDMNLLAEELNYAYWASETNITDETEAAASKVNEKSMEYTTAIIAATRTFDGLELDADTARQIALIKLSTSMPAPDDAEMRAELAAISTKLTGIYGKGKWCPEGAKEDDEACEDLEELSKRMRESKDMGVRLDAWKKWRSISPPMKEMYSRFVEIANKGAKEYGFEDLGILWKSGYDMDPAAFEKETDRLWEQVKPLYDELHCHVRAELAKKAPTHVKDEGTLPAHVFGNMWAQDWSYIYDLIEPYQGQPSVNVDAELKANYDANKMVKLSENFFTSIGLEPLPETFFERSMFTKPDDREVVCHASAWDVTNTDWRIKMCIEQTEEELITIHHELGHIYYYIYYKNLPQLFQAGANDGFHEAIGDAIALSVNPQYLADRGLLKEAPKDDKGLINVQMAKALEKVAFLPFGKMIDQWRWDVFSGKTTPENYNESWWELRKKYQGVHAPIERAATDFDPGAKFHIPANVPYMRYFLAHILQFQFQKALCDAAGYEGPLHACSIYGNKEAGAKLQALLELGASKPWPDALEAVTGQREMDATAILDYFAPLMTWLQTQNKDRKCGW